MTTTTPSTAEPNTAALREISTTADNTTSTSVNEATTPMPDEVAPDVVEVTSTATPTPTPTTTQTTTETPVVEQEEEEATPVTQVAQATTETTTEAITTTPTHPPVTQRQVQIHVSCRNLKNMDTLSLSDPLCVVYQGEVPQQQEQPQQKEVKEENVSDSPKKNGEATAVSASPPPQGITWIEIGRTEVIDDNLNPKWIKSFLVDYHPERVQWFRFVVYDVDTNSAQLKQHDLIGEFSTPLCRVLSAKGNCLQGKLTAKVNTPTTTTTTCTSNTKDQQQQQNGNHNKNSVSSSGKDKEEKRGTIHVIAEEIDATNRDDFYFEVHSVRINKMDWFGSADGYFVISKPTLDHRDLIPVYKSEVIYNSLTPKWSPVTLNLNKVCNGDMNRVLQFDCYDWNRAMNHRLIGSFRFTIRELLTDELSMCRWPLVKKAKKRSGGMKTKGEIEFRNYRRVSW